MNPPPAAGALRAVATRSRSPGRHGKCGDASEADGGRAFASSSALAQPRLLYQGYPFDRLRHRLGLEPDNPALVDLDDLTCASPEQLDSIDPTTLDDPRLVDAIASAVGLRDDTRTARLAAEYLARQHVTIPRLDLAELVSPLVRLAIERQDPDGAIRWIERAMPLGSVPTAKTLDVWRHRNHGAIRQARDRDFDL